MNIRKAVIDDVNEIMDIYAIAQDFMIESGNPNQWGHFYPSRDLIEHDIENEVCLLICDDESPHGVFALFSGDEPTYQYIEDGEWVNDDEYVTVHRIASDGKLHGIFKCVIDYCKGISDNIRIDTHKSNKIMQKQIEKNGFRKCGTIYVADGSPRIAYQWSRK
ncbi:hypothetical protein [Methanobrevibacter sp. YE315]|uniref:hypothetical protein n=1 Tax=Methanobrevibacter sp. YE315 TaxID=1609968 RepID=UPI000AF725D3|nr:hypothetical protein [Methanobrevibacter sp. YE315]